MESVASRLTGMLMLANVIVGLGPYAAGMIVAVLARRSDPAARQLTFAGCLAVPVSYFGYSGFAMLPLGHGADQPDLAADVFRGLLETASVALLVLAIASALRALRGRAETGLPPSRPDVRNPPAHRRPPY